MKLPVAAAAFCAGFAVGSAASGSRRLRVVGADGRTAPASATAILLGGKARAVAALGVERIRDTVGVRLGWRDGDEAAEALIIEMAGDLASALNARRIPA